MTNLSEAQFATLITEISGDPGRAETLKDFLLEDHAIFEQRGTAATIRMRGWILLALAHAGLSESAILFALEELDTGNDPYLVAAAARALRSCPEPSPAFAPFLMRAFTNLRYRDDPVTLESYGGYGSGTSSTSPLREVLTTLAWLGPKANSILPQLKMLRDANPGISGSILPYLDKAIAAIDAEDPQSRSGGEECCGLPVGMRGLLSWARTFRHDSSAVEKIVFQDQDGTAISFSDLLCGHCSIVVFFYTRCDNPLKCSLTITKLARVQKLLEERGLSGKIWTVAITYDPGFDLPNRLQSYGKSRGAHMDSSNRIVRTTCGFDALRAHFKLGVNFIASLVNRHRVEAYVVDEEGRAAFCFERIHWDENQIVDCAAQLWSEHQRRAPNPEPERKLQESTPATRKGLIASPFWGTLCTLGLALFPKCPACWASYLSIFGIAAIRRILHPSWLLFLLVALMLVNFGAAWVRRHSALGRIALFLVGTGTLMTMFCRFAWPWDHGALLGVFLTFLGSITSVVQARRNMKVVSKPA